MRNGMRGLLLPTLCREKVGMRARLGPHPAPSPTFGGRGGLGAALALLLSSACTTPRIAAKTGYDFSKIRRISVVPFEGQGGSAASDEFVRGLLATGIEVTDAHHQGDAILRGTVGEYKPNNQLTVFLGNTTLMTPGGQTAVIDNPVVSLAGSQATPEGATSGVHNAQIISIIATVGVYVSLIDPSTKNVLWAGHYTYEGLDIQGTLRTVAGMVTQSMAKVVPRMNK